MTSGDTNQKHLLRTFTADATTINQSIEGLVKHEIKSLGMHALVLTVTYAIPGEVINGAEESRVMRSFRKRYNFNVSTVLCQKKTRLKMRRNRYQIPFQSAPKHTPQHPSPQPLFSIPRTIVQSSSKSKYKILQSRLFLFKECALNRLRDLR